MADLPFLGALDLIKQNHPDIFALLSKDGVAAVALRMVQAEQDGHPWTSAQIDAAFSSTPYFLNTPLAQRQFDVLQATDPASANTKIQDTKRIFEDMETQLGIRPSMEGGLGSANFQLFWQAVTNGWDANRIKYELVAHENGSTVGGGEIGAHMAEVKKMADDYGVPMADLQVLQWGNQIAQGSQNADTVKGYLIQQAKSLFPSLTKALDEGTTVRQYADPYFQLAAQELNVNPADIHLTDAKWMKALNQIDPKTGARVPMALDQWLSTIRTDSAYGYDSTHQAAQGATQLASAIQQKFGASA